MSGITDAQFLDIINRNYRTKEEYGDLSNRLGGTNLALLEAALGAAGEVGEVVDVIKKSIFYEKPLDNEHLLEELGDAVHYLTRIAHLTYSSMSVVRQANATKVMKRFPNGFNTADAIARKDKENG